MNRTKARIPRARRLGLIGLALAALAPLAGAQQWVATGSLNCAREWGYAVLLTSGKALIVGGGGANGVYCTRAELYDPTTGKFEYTGALNYPAISAGVLLPSGKALFFGSGYYVGTWPSGTTQYAPPELYDPSTGTFSNLPPMPTQIQGGVDAMMLQDGRIFLLAGAPGIPFGQLGGAPCSCQTYAYIYDPASGSYTQVGNFSGEVGDAWVLLPSGDVFIVGGVGTGNMDPNSPAMIYHLATNQWETISASPHLVYCSAVLLPSGKVLVSGGALQVSGPGGLRAGANYYAWLFDPSSKTFSRDAGYSPGGVGVSISLPSGHILGPSPAFATLYDPASDTFSQAGWTAAAAPITVQLADGTVLAAGGADFSTSPPTALATAQLFHENVTEYTLSNPGLFPSVPSAVGSFQINSSPVNGYSGQIASSCEGVTGVVTDVACGFSPNPLAAGNAGTLNYSGLVCNSELYLKTWTPDFNYWEVINPQGPQLAVIPDPASVTVSSGQPASYEIQIPNCTAPSIIKLTCSNLPQYAACTFTGPSLNDNPNYDFSLTVATNASSSSAMPSAGDFNSGPGHTLLGPGAELRTPLFAWLAAGLTLMAALALMGSFTLSSNSRLRRPRVPVLALGVLLSALALSFCGRQAAQPSPSNSGPGGGGGGGGSSTGPSTAPGTYTITVTAATYSASTNKSVTVSTPITLIVH
jgi:hypothetical protein